MNVNEHYYSDGNAYLSPKTTSTIALANVLVAMGEAWLTGYPDDTAVTVTATVSLTDATNFETDYGSVALYASKSPTIDPLDPTTYFYQVGSGSAQSNYYINFSEKKNGLRAGDTVFIAVGYVPVCGTTAYRDPSGKNVFPAVGPLSTPAAIVVP
jgi:hypothetical protein